jgi:hypothetical protein
VYVGVVLHANGPISKMPLSVSQYRKGTGQYLIMPVAIN